MSLKAFHIFFIIVSILFCLGFAWWEVDQYGMDGTFGRIAAAIGIALVAAGLVVYLMKVIKNLRNVKPI